MKTLKSILKKELFDMVLSGEMKERYLELTPYWKSRLYDETGVKPFEQVTFSNAYGLGRPSVTLKFKGVTIGEPNPEWAGEKLDNLGEECFRIHLGEEISREKC